MPHARIAADFGGCPFGKQGAVDEHRNRLRETEDELHVVFDEHQRDVRRQAADDLENLLALGFRNARCRFVEQQHFRPRGYGQRDFEQALLTVGQRADTRVESVGEAEAREQLDRLDDELAAAADRPQPFPRRLPRARQSRRARIAAG